MEKLFAEHRFDACIHFAGLKAVGESVEKPWEYYENNIGGTLTLVDVMRKHGCKKFSFHQLPFMVTLQKFPSQKTAPKDNAPIPTAGQRAYWSRC